MILVESDTVYDTDVAMFYTLYHIFKQESIQGRGTIDGRGMIKGRHLALYQIFKTTVFTTIYMINICIPVLYGASHKICWSIFYQPLNLIPH